ncbi:HypC/HybG/HupF family hydrogenase formation chaperone [bacterium]|nr:HypC/HybG/HupF family hydrogenase formation chaperone [bacterium]
MCLAIPGKVVEMHESEGILLGKVDFGGIVKQVCLQYTPDVKTGEWVIVHVGFSLSKMDEEEAARTYKLLEELNQLSELDIPDVDSSEINES